MALLSSWAENENMWVRTDGHESCHAIILHRHDNVRVVWILNGWVPLIVQAREGGGYGRGSIHDMDGDGISFLFLVWIGRKGRLGVGEQRSQPRRAANGLRQDIDNREQLINYSVHQPK